MYILGIHDGHDASAALLLDGKIIAAAQEERFSDLKGDYGFPKHAVDYCLQEAGISGDDLEHVALSSRVSNPILTYLKRNANFSVSDWVEEQERYWKPKLLEHREVSYFDIYRDKPYKKDAYYDFSGLLNSYMQPNDMGEFLERRLTFISTYLGISKERIVVTNHETNHKCYALFASPFRQKPVLVLTSEGIGDEYNSTVSVYEKGELRTLCNMKENHLGHVYQYVTLILGMKPAQHEYKVMGLAPYANQYETDKAYRFFRSIMKVDGLEIRFDQKPKDLYYAIRDGLMDCRFDGIAGGLQKFLEETLCQWIENCVAETKIGTVVFGGGVAQNIKAAKAMSELDCVKEIFVPPAAGDTSNSVGACFNVYLHEQENPLEADQAIPPLETIYLGPAYDQQDIEHVIEAENLDKEYRITRGVDNTKIASLLAEGKIVGVMRGRMEFGLRALGNRSILANPSDPLVLDRINQKIKFRDFWMPFTPTMLDRRAGDYILNPKNHYSPYMTMAFDSVAENRHAFVAAMHPADKSVRAQILSREKNPVYYDLITEFEKITGHGVVLNTSFNLHGKAVVLGPEEAIFTFRNSMMDALVMEDVLIER